MTTQPLLEEVVSALTAVDVFPSNGCISDEMHHTGGAGFSEIQRWPVNPSKPLVLDDTENLWVWRVLYRSKRNQTPARMQYGMARGQEAAQKVGRSAARRLAKMRRAMKLTG